MQNKNSHHYRTIVLNADSNSDKKKEKREESPSKKSGKEKKVTEGMKFTIKIL
jgi:hypothetical protein